jgi:NADPH:quinone reductase-like Zn-dependent oxidoreductase
VYPIPETITNEEACNLASSYLNGIHSLFGLADTKKGSKVLIHSASGGLGLACPALPVHRRRGIRYLWQSRET